MKTPRKLLVLVCGCLSAISPTWGDSFVLDPTSPTLGIIGATSSDILYDVPGVGGVPGVPPPPSIGVPFAALGLLPGDVIDAISDGIDPVSSPHLNYFSVTRGSVGVPGTGVNIEATALDTPPGATPGHAGDIFVAGLGLPVGVNILAPAGFGWTLGTTTGDEANTNLITPTLPPAAGDNVNAYDLGFLPPGGPVWFSLAPGSPTLGLLGYAAGTGGADIFVGGGGGFVLSIPAASLGLPPAADIDALALQIAGSFIEYSLTTATSGLHPAALGSGATILGSGGGGASFTAHTPASLGLLVTDDLDALDVGQQPVPEPGAMALLAVGAGLIGFRHIRRKRC